MASENIITQVRQGMEVHTADGHTLGKVARVWFGTDPTASNPRCDEDTCSRIEVHSGRIFKRRVLYVPYSAISDITAGHVTLTLDAAAVNERNWLRMPAWIAAIMTGADEAGHPWAKTNANISVGPMT
jgi:hypothetical protein